MSKKIALIVGAYPPDACGIGDYSYQLVHSDIDKWICIIWKEWNLTGLLKLIRKIKKLDTVYVNLQYPTKSSYGSLMPHLLCIYFSLFTNKRFMITLHEFMRMSITYRLAAFLFLLFANKIIFTTQVEKDYAMRLLPFRRDKFHVIHLFSNISKAVKIKETSMRHFDFAYFGLISKGRNIERFIEIVKRIQLNHQVNAAIIGMVSEGCNNYVDILRCKSGSSGIEFILNKRDQEVADFLNECKYVYLPFNDGVSERRGSFLASVINGALVITTKGPWTTKRFDKVCYYMDDNECELLKDLLNGRNILISHNNIAEFLNEYDVKSWIDVSEQYFRLCN